MYRELCGPLNPFCGWQMCLVLTGLSKYFVPGFSIYPPLYTDRLSDPLGFDSNRCVWKLGSSRGADARGREGWNSARNGGGGTLGPTSWMLGCPASKVTSLGTQKTNFWKHLQCWGLFLIHAYKESMLGCVLVSCTVCVCVFCTTILLDLCLCFCGAVCVGSSVCKELVCVWLWRGSI